MLSEHASRVLENLGGRYRGAPYNAVQFNPEDWQRAENLSASLFEAICAASRAVGAGEELSAREYVEMREERDEAVSNLGAAECARDEYRATVNSVARERDALILALHRFGQHEAACAQEPGNGKGCDCEYGRELARWILPSEAPHGS